ncbi:Type II toxin-antitoxin system RelE/ParE family toxin [Cupriavidus sp. H19C3]|uniref:type II toxin-antitoxin system RelE/ParE family toxin n=1 Tax=Cupriavidus sp. H19C3 TaxID=3241603 RepID=UPI003BF899B8
MRKIIVSKNAKKDFNQIKSYVVKKFSNGDWNKIVDEWQDNLKKVANNPSIGTNIQELDGTGYLNFKKYHHKNVYAVYSFSDDEIRVHMFIPSMRDFRTHLMNRLLNP